MDEDIRAQLARLTDLVLDLQQRTPPLLVSESEAADRLCVSVRTVKRWVADRQIPYVQIGGKVRIDMSALRAVDKSQLSRGLKAAGALLVQR